MILRFYHHLSDKGYVGIGFSAFDRYEWNIVRIEVLGLVLFRVLCREDAILDGEWEAEVELLGFGLRVSWWRKEGVR